MFARKGVFSSIGRAGAVATVMAVALTAVEPSISSPALRRKAAVRRSRPGRAGRPISAPVAAITVAAVAPRLRLLLPASSAPVSRLRPARAAATIMTDTVITTPRPPITAAAQSTTAEALLWRRPVLRRRPLSIERATLPWPPARQLVIAVPDRTRSRRLNQPAAFFRCRAGR